MEWGPVHVFRNAGNRFVDMTDASGLDLYIGWWNGVATGDFDGDGQLDIVASNWGWNSPYQSAADGRRVAQAIISGNAVKPAAMKFPIILYGDLDGNGTVDIFEAEIDKESRMAMPTRSRNAMAQVLPSILDRFPSYAAYNSTTLSNLVGDSQRLNGREWLRGLRALSS